MTKEKDTEQQDLVTRAFSVREKESGKDIILRPNSNRTVQSIALMRLGLFVHHQRVWGVKIGNIKRLALTQRKSYRRSL